jgi:phosphate transport system substrate-binding protein
MRRLRYILAASLAAALALSFGACKKVEREGTAGTAAGVTGTMQVKGSDTLLMLSQRWAESFMDENPEAVVQVTGGGSGVGIKALIEGTTDVANASRPIKEEEREEAQAKGVEVNEIAVAVDGICFVVNAGNPLAELTVGQLGDIYRGKAKDWSAFGGAGRIMCYGRQSTSGTYDFVARDANGIAYVGYGYAAKRDDVKILAVKADDASGAVKPTHEAVASMEYPISRYLFCYINGKAEGVTRAFLAFALSDAGQKIVEEVEYVALPSSKLSESRAAVE